MTDQQALDRLIAIRGNPGVRFGVTGADYAECTAVPHSLERDVLGIDITYGNAINMYSNASDADFIKLPAGTPIRPADIIIQGGDPVLQTSSDFGHVTVGVVQLGGGWFRAYSQNYPTGREPHVRDFPPNGMLGILRARVLQSGGGNTVDPRYPEDWANIAYQLWFQRVPTPAERQLRVGIPWDQARVAIAGAANGPEFGLQTLFVIMYEHGLGRSRHAQPGQPGYINIAAEITPRVASILNNQTAILDHIAQIDNSAERAAYLAAKGGDVSGPKLAQAKNISNQSNQAITNL